MPLIDPKSDPRLVEIPHPALPIPTQPPWTGGPAMPGPVPNIPPPMPPPPGPVQGPLPPASDVMLAPEAPSILERIMQAYNWPRDQLWGGLSALAGQHQGYDEQRARVMQGVEAPIRWLPEIKDGRLIPPTPAPQILAHGLGTGISGALLDAGADPGSYAGAGALKGIGTELNMAPKVLAALGLGDKLLNAPYDLPIRGALWAGKTAVKGATSIPGTGLGLKVLEDGASRSATSLYDWATHDSPQTAVKMVGRALDNAVGHLRQQGNSLEMGLGDWIGRKSMAQWPGNVSDAMTRLNRLQDVVTNKITTAGASSPEAAEHGAEILKQLDQFKTTLQGRYKAARADLQAQGLPAAEVAKQSNEQVQASWRQLMDLTQASGELFDDLLPDIAGPASDVMLKGPMSPEQRVAVARKMSQRMEQLKFLHDDLPGFLADLPSQFKSAQGSWYGSQLDKGMKDFAAQFSRMIGDQKTLEEGLRYAWDRKNPGQAFPTIAASNPKERLAGINQVLQGMGMAPVEGAGGLVQALKPHLPTRDANGLDDILKYWGQDFLQRDLFDNATQRVVREHAKSLGLEPATGVKSGVQDALAFWKTQALDSPAFLLKNLMSGLFMGGLRGVPPQEVMRGLAQNVGTMLKGGEPELGTLTQLNDLLGQVTPHEVTSSTGAAFLNTVDDVKQLLGQDVNIMDKLGAPLLGAGGAGLGAWSGYSGTPSDHPDDRWKNTAQGAATGAVAGGSLPFTTKFLLTRLGGGLETIMRQAAYTKALAENVGGHAPDLHRIAEGGLLAPRAGVNQAPSATVTAALDGLKARGGFVSPSQLEDLLHGHGVDLDTARATGKQWQDVLEGAKGRSARFSNQIHFDYEQMNNLEQLVKQFSPFATWGMKAYPFYAEELAKHPRVALSLLRMTLEQEKERQAKGLTDKFAGSMHVPALDQFWSAVTGRPEQAWVNPMQSLSPFADAAKLGTINENETPFEQGNKVLDAFGFSLNPAIDQLSRMTGLTSGSAATGGYLRHSGAIKGLTSQLGMVNGRGVDLDAPVKDIERALRMAFRGLEPTDLGENAVLRRVDELALKDTGKTITSGHPAVLPYLEARAQRSGGLWDKAQADVSRDGAGRSLYGLMLGVGAPQALLGEEERRIREAQGKRVLEPEVTEKLRNELRAGNYQQVRPDLVAPLQKAALDVLGRSGSSTLPPEVQQVLLLPTVANLEKLRGWIQDADAEDNPLALGYASGGSPEEIRLASALTAYHSLPMMIHADPHLSHLRPEEIDALVRDNAAYSGQKTGPAAYINKYYTQRQEQLLAENPMLGAYLAWQKTQRGYGNPRTFMKEVWSRPDVRAQFTQAQDKPGTPAPTPSLTP